MTFDDAIADSKRFKARHLLLGNGFSIAYSKNFDYRSLFQKAKSSGGFSGVSYLPKVFTKMKTKDFERVIKILRDASEVLKIHEKTNSGVSAMRRNANHLKRILVGTIASTHPRDRYEINDDQFIACRDFLKHFLGDKNKGGGGGEIYTLNYDFLLYWACMYKDEYLGEDGFGRKGANGPLIWKNRDSQTVHYLHGALHFFNNGLNLEKYAYDWNTGDSILSQVRGAMSSGKFPLFVAEGESEEKLLKIEDEDNEYLSHCYESFSQKMEKPSGVLFIFGHSLTENDNHIFDCIIKGKIPRVYVGLHGYAISQRNGKIMALANGWKIHRGKRYPLEVKFFYAKGAKVWG